MSVEKCVICETSTKYSVDDHVDIRENYIEGLGQLCNTCHRITNNDVMVTIPKILIENTPNDSQLGQIMRKIYWGIFKGDKN